MAVNLSILAGAGWQFFDDSGRPLSGGLLYTYIAGSDTPATTYTTSAGNIAHSNPIELDAAGRVAEEIWMTSTLYYKFVLKDKNEVLIGTWDNLSAVSSSAELANASNVALGDNLIGFRQSNSSGVYANAVVSTVHVKLQDFVSVIGFGAVGDGVADDTTAIQNAVDTGRAVLFPIVDTSSGIYRITSPITISTTGQVLYGESEQNVYITSDPGSTHDLIRCAASIPEIHHILFRPGNYSDASPPTFACIRVYAAWAKIHHNRFLSSSSGHGCAIFLDDVNPATSGVVAGAYTHTIFDNNIGASGFGFKYSIYSYCANNGQQATTFLRNIILGDIPFYVYKGGGNYYCGNVMQSATGTFVTGVGNAIDLQDGVAGETISGNYFERYDYGVIMRRVSTANIVAHIFGNHWDNNNTNIFSTGGAAYVYFNEESFYQFYNGWQYRYNSEDNFTFYNLNGVQVYNVNRALASFEPRVIGQNTYESLSYTGNNQTKTPTSSWVQITGAGVDRTGCYLGNGSRDGQHLYITGLTWKVQILNNPGSVQNVFFDGNAASVTFGNVAGNIAGMHLMWNSTLAMWIEMGRCTA